MAMEQKEKQPPPPTPPPASPSISSSGEETPPPEIPPMRKPSAGSTWAALQNPLDPSSDSTKAEEDAESDAAKPNAPPRTQDSRNAAARDGEKVDSSTESGQSPPPPPPPSAENAEMKEAATLIVALGGAVSHEEEEEEEEEESEHNSDFDQMTSPAARNSSPKAADLSLNPLSSNTMDIAAQRADRSPNSMKRSAPFPAPDSEERRRRTAAGDGAEGGQEKKDIFKRVWSNEDELVLVKGILDYKKCHSIFPSTQVHLESLLISVKDSLSISASLSQMNEKIRRIKKKYNNTAQRVNGAKNPKFSNAHDAAVFDLSRKIWGSTKDKRFFLQNMTTSDKMKEDIKNEKIGGNQSTNEYPSLLWFLEREHANIALVLTLSHIPVAKAKELEGECKKLEIPETELLVQKGKLLGDALKLIQDALAKCG